MSRSLSQLELALLTRIAEGLGADLGARLRRDIEVATAQPLNDEGTRIGFDLRGYDRPPYVGQHAYPLEGRIRDADGGEVSVIVHADQNDHLLELELIKWGSAKLICPVLSTFSLAS